MRGLAVVSALLLLALVPASSTSLVAATDPLPECAVDKRADADLNGVYKQLVTKLTAEELKRLRAAQSAWIAFRDAECLSESGGGPEQGGTIWPLIHNECLVDLTRKRTRELREQVKCPGGHLEC